MRPGSLLTRSLTVFRGALYSAGFVWFWTWLVGLVRTPSGNGKHAGT